MRKSISELDDACEAQVVEDATSLQAATAEHVSVDAINDDAVAAKLAVEFLVGEGKGLTDLECRLVVHHGEEYGSDLGWRQNFRAVFSETSFVPMHLGITLGMAIARGPGHREFP